MSADSVGLLRVLGSGKHAPLPLHGASVKAHISGYLVGLDSTLKYRNDGDDPIEVVFRFPLEESFAVVGLEAVLGGRRIKAEIREKEEARQMYDDAIASGFSAALAEEKAGDIFSVSLGNLPPKADAELHLKMVGELPVDAEGAVRFALPSVLKQRYTPAESFDPLEKVGGADAQSASAPGVFSFTLEVDGSGVSSVTSPTHREDAKVETKRGVIHLSLTDKPLQEDLVVLVSRRQPHEPYAIVENGEEGAKKDSIMHNPVVMLNFFPEFSGFKAACEFVFVVDRSGSMGGAFIRSASETLVLFLKSIPPGCYFNIIGFGSRYESLFPESVPYNQTNLDKAVQHAQHLQADLGGTELLPPLRHVFQHKALPGLPRQIFVLTDGSVSNTDACIHEVKKNAGSARCFTFGIGSGASTALVKGLARAGNGTAEFVQSGERLQPKVIRSLKHALQPSVVDISVTFKGLPHGLRALQAPSKPPVVFNGEKTVMYGILEGNMQLHSPVDCTAVLKGQILDKPVKFSVPFTLPGSGPSFSLPILHHLAAKSLIKDWEGEEDGGKKTKADIVKLSVAASVVSSHTAFIAVDEEQNEPIKGSMKTWDITATAPNPFNVSLGARKKKRGAIPAHNYGLMMMYSASVPPPPSGVLCSSLGAVPPPPPPGTQSSMSMSFGGMGGGGGEELFDDLLCCSSPPMAPQSSMLMPEMGGGGFDCDMLSAAPPPPGPPPASQSWSFSGGGELRGLGGVKRSAEPKLRKAADLSTPFTDAVSGLVSLQQAEGSWRMDAALAGILGKNLKELESGCPVKCEGSVGALWATMLALEFLKSRHSAQRDEWELVAMKAEMWLSQQSTPAGVDFSAAAKTAIKG